MEKLAGHRVIELRRKVANLRNEYDSLLKELSAQYIDLPPNMQKQLEEHAQFKNKLGMYAMDLSLLSEFYCTTSERNIEKKIAIMYASHCNQKIEKHLHQVNNQLADAKSFSDGLRSDYKCSADINRSLGDVNRQIGTFVEKKKKLEENIEVDLDRVLMKLDLLAK